MIECLDNTTRLRAWWYRADGHVWCIDTELSPSEIAEVWSICDRNLGFDLPNLRPEVSHGMTYLFRVKRGEQSHEALGYHVDVPDCQEMFGPDWAMALNWSRIIAGLLAARTINESQIIRSEFDEHGHVKWGESPTRKLDHVNEREE